METRNEPVKKKPLFIVCPDAKGAVGFKSGNIYIVYKFEYSDDPKHGSAFTVKNDYGNTVSVYEKNSILIDGKDWIIGKPAELYFGIAVIIGLVVVGLMLLSLLW